MSERSELTVGVVVIAAGRHDHVRRVVASLGRQTVPPARTVLVDLGSTPPLADVVDRPDQVDVVELPSDHRRGLPLAAARNLGAEHLSPLDLVFLDADCIAAPDLVGRYARVLAAQPGALACGPVRYLRQSWTVACGDDPAGEALVEASDAHAARPVPRNGGIVVDDRHDLFWSLSFGVTDATWRLLGGFDPAYVGYGGEDTDLAERARRLGVPLAWFGGGTAFHQWHPPSRLDPGRTAELVGNAHRFRQRWGRWPMEGWLQELSDAGHVDFDPARDRLVLRAGPP